MLSAKITSCWRLLYFQMKPKMEGSINHPPFPALPVARQPDCRRSAGTRQTRRPKLGRPMTNRSPPLAVISPRCDGGPTPIVAGHDCRGGGNAMGNYRSIYRRSLEQPAAFWAEAAAALHWDKPWDRVLDARGRPSTAGSRAAGSTPATTRSTATSTRGRGDQAALIYDSPVTGTGAAFTYAELRDEVARFAGALARARRRQGRPRHHLHADGAGGGDRDAGLRADRRRALGGVRRLRRQRARHPHRRRQAEGRSSPPPAASRSAG